MDLKSPDGLETSIMMCMGDGSRGRGRPRMRWMDEVREMTGLSLQVQTEGGDERQRDVEEEEDHCYHHGSITTRRN